MRENVSLARLIESNKENLNNNQMFIDLIEEKVHRKQVEMRKRHLTTTNNLSWKRKDEIGQRKELSSFEGVRISNQLNYAIVEMQG
ncbi:hypothetical protein P9443_01995 [Peribacillus frigoritolerans]|jgi:ribosomal protein S13|uniref:hypothetical protein n=2 Tax=Peribacillus frigoritolerans TaxID=450367 RepID=UPI00228307BB|nr:hypothetical protein [Peribacillus frigoritolerans]MCY9004074.1 hypothetical protein [Peribacillus frigoritolerans]MED4631685.1 hypothetical protein [Peribacillus frigoritolerans]